MRLATLTFLLTVNLSGQFPDFYRTIPRVFWVVDDATRVAAAWQKAGVPHGGGAGPITSTGAQFRGRTVSHSFWMYSANFANLQADWVQPLSGDSAWSEFLQRHGSGIFALAYRAPSLESLEAEVDRLQSLGVSILERGTLPRSGSRGAPYVFLDTAAQGKFCLGLIYDPEPEVDPREAGPRVTQFALTADDPDSVSAYWQKLGFPAFTFTHPDLTDKVYRGSPADFDMRLGWQRHLSIPFEWVQPLRGPNVYEDHIAKHGEGFHHIAFDVPDMDKADAHWNALGFPVTMSGGWGEKNAPGSGRFAYHDAHSVGGIDIELLWNYGAPATLPAHR